ncbi:hypothetical protein N2152v2_005960 [Parachlorella kessleri]
MDQENQSILLNSPGQHCTLVPARPPGSGCLSHFSFQQPRARIDWRALHSVDVDCLVRGTDIDALERVLDVVAFGDIEAEDARNLTPHNFIKLFRIAQLTVEYLLFVQDRLAGDNCAMKGELGKLRSQVAVLQLKVKEQREEVVAGRKELKHVKRTLRTIEALALAQRQQPQQAAAPPQLQPEVQVIERVVETVDAATQYKLERIEAEARQLMQEREAMQREILSLKDALAAALAGTGGQAAASEEAAARAVEVARSAKHEARADAEEVRALSDKLAESLRRQRELEKQKDMLELELVHALGSPKRAMPPTSQVPQLRADLEAAKAEIRGLQRKLREGQGPGEHHSMDSPRKSSASRLHASGVGSLLEDASDASDVRVQELQAELDLLKARLTAALSAEAEAQRRCLALQEELDRAHDELQNGKQQGHDNPDWRASEIERLDGEVARLRTQNKELGAANAALRREGKKHYPGSPVVEQRSTSASPNLPQSPGRIKAQHVSSQRDAPLVVEAKGSGLGSPIEAGLVSEDAELDEERPADVQSEHKQRPQQRSPRHSPSVKEHFDEDMQYTLAGHERPGVVSRLPHSLNSMRSMRRELLGELNVEVQRELATYGVSAKAQGMTDAQFRAAMEELEARRDEARAGMSAQDRQRMEYMRETVSTHVAKVARRVASSERGWMEDADDQLIPESAGGPGGEAFYSPLRSGASQLSFKSDSLPGSPQPPSPPRSTSGPLMHDEDGTPRSPWAITHDKVFNTLDVGDSESPLRQGARQSPLLSGSPGRSQMKPGLTTRSPGGRSPAAAQMQRLPRRVSQARAAGATEIEEGGLGQSGRSYSQQGSPARRRLEVGAPSSPGTAHRYPPGADADSPLLSPSRQRQQQRQPRSPSRPVTRSGRADDARDHSTDAAELVRPVASVTAARMRSNVQTLRASLKKLE